MKKILLSLFVLGCALTGQAQATTDAMKAVLQHGDQVSVFNGANAYGSALTAAVDGDVITLSEGQFAAAHITKAVSIYGAGYENDAETGTAVTCINGNFSIGVAGDTLGNVHMEGLYLNGTITAGHYPSYNWQVPLKGLTFEKCWIQQTLSMSGYIENLTFKQCVLMNGVSRSGCTNMLVTNCILFGQLSGAPANCETLVDHSISATTYYGSSGQSITWTNSIFATGAVPICGPYSVVKNCIKQSNLNWPLNTTTYENIYDVASIADIFADAENTSYSAERTWELQQPDVWIGTDGTQVGIHGGIGWSKAPRTPVIRSLELNVVGSQLRINYEAEAR